MTAPVVVLVPVLGRTEKIPGMADSLRGTCATARLLLICSLSDVPLIAFAEANGYEHIEVPGPFAGDYARKINEGYRRTDEPLVFLGADDIVFHHGWFEAARAKMVDGVGVVGTQDLGSQRVIKGLHATHSLVSREYADTFGTVDGPGEILNEAYKHNFCDDELVGTAKARGAWAFADDSIVEHFHPAWGKAENDDVYRRGRSGFKVDRRLFYRRERMWR